MKRTYEYRGYYVEVTVEPTREIRARTSAPVVVLYVASVQITPARDPLTVVDALRFEEVNGRPFMSDIDALMVGFGGACRRIDELL